MENARVPISIADFQGVKSAAEAAVDAATSSTSSSTSRAPPEQVRAPVYVSDRRLVKSIALLRVAAYTNGRSAVSEFDCLLLANAVATSQRVERDPRLDPRATGAGPRGGPGAVSAGGALCRACRADGDPAECAELREEAARLREVLSSQMQSLAGATSGSMPALRITCGCPRRMRSAPRRRSARSSGRCDAVRETPAGVPHAGGGAGAKHGTAHHALPAGLLADFIRSGPIEDVKLLGEGRGVM